MRVYYCNRNTEVIKGSVDKTLYKDKNEIMLSNAIKEKKKIAISYYLKRIKDDNRKLYVINNCLENNFELNNHYQNNYHYLLSKLIQTFYYP